MYILLKLKFQHTEYSSLEAILLSKRFIKKIFKTDSFPLKDKKIIFQDNCIKFLKNLIRIIN